MSGVSKETERFLKTLYDEYRFRKNNGLSSSKSKYFCFDELGKTDKVLQNYLADDIYDYVDELVDNELAEKTSLSGDFQLTDTAITYLENRFKNTVNEILSIIEKLK